MAFITRTVPKRRKFTRPLLGTFVEISVAGDMSEAKLQQAADKAFDLISFVQRLMSVYEPSSDISRLNQCAHVAPLPVHPWTLHVLRKALAISRETQGAFDIATPGSPGDSLEKSQTCHDIELPGDNSVFFRKPLQINLSSIAKGFAVDKAADYLGTLGLESAVVDAGSDLRVVGSQLPMIESMVPAIMPRAAVAMSAGYCNNRPRHGLRVQPILHPRTGKPMRSTTRLSVFAPTCLLADVLTKAVLLAPQEIWTRVLASYDSLALFLTAKGEEIHFPAFRTVSAA